MPMRVVIARSSVVRGTTKQSGRSGGIEQARLFRNIFRYSERCFPQ